MKLFNRKGSVMIMSIIAMAIVFMMATYCLYMTTFQNHLSSTLDQRIRDRHVVENDINKVLYSSGEGELIDSLKWCIIDAIGQPGKVFSLTSEDLGSSAGLIGKVLYKSGQLSIDLVYPEDKFNETPKVSIQGSVLNPLYNEGEPLVSPSVLDEAGLEQLNSSLELLPGLAEEVELPDNRMLILEEGSIDMTLKKSGYNDYKASVICDGFTTEYWSIQPKYSIIQLSKREIYDTITLRIEANNNITGVKGIIYVEGDVIVESNFKLNGIMIIRGGSLTVADGASLVVNGKLISDQDLDTKGVQTFKALEIVAQVGIHLPGFYKPVIQYIKVY